MQTSAPFWLRIPPHSLIEEEPCAQGGGLLFNYLWHRTRFNWGEGAFPGAVSGGNNYSDVYLQPERLGFL
jgi:hypothetical protein